MGVRARSEVGTLDASDRLRPFVAGLVAEWLADTPNRVHRASHGTLVFVDISGFTRLTERLAAKGKIGAEEMSDILDVTFAALLGVAYEFGAWLVKWGGDAVVLLFEGEDDAERACTAAHEMRQTMRQVGRLRTSVGNVTLRMSVGVHSGEFDFYLLGSLHKELVITGPGATATVNMESAAEAGEILVSSATAAQLPPACVGAAKGDGYLLARSPASARQGEIHSRDLGSVDLGGCLPEVTRDHLLAGGTDGEHRLVAVGFVEYSGVEAVRTLGGADAVAAAVGYVIQRCQEAAHRHQVTFWETDVGVDGGKVMLVSGAPRSAGQDEDRMLATVRDILDGGGELAVRAGVNAGRVYAGEFGPPFRRTFSVKGDAVNLAARLMSRAGIGEIYAADAVLARARTRYETHALPPLVVKGKQRPVVAHRVGAALSGNAGTARIDLPFAGRETEISALLQALADARGGRGGCWEIRGEAGIGKSRLMAELIARAEATTVVGAACDLYHTATPYAPFRRILRQLAGIADDADPVAAGASLLDVVARAAPSLLPWTPLVAAVVDARVPSSPEVDALDAKFRKAQQDEYTARLIAALVPRALLLVIEDVHLMDDASSGLFNELAKICMERPWLVVTTARPSDEATTAVPDEAHRLDLRPLSSDAVDAMVKLATDDVPLPPHELALLARRAGGNPLFVHELLGAARAGGTVSSLPDTVEGVMAVQIDRLQPRERLVLRIASVLGIRIDERVLREMLEQEGLDPDVVRFGVLTNFLETDADGARFRHTLARDTAYEGLPFSRRQSLHGRAGVVIERLAAGRTDEVADLLSMHYLHARKFDAAWRYARTAGHRAREVHAQVAAAEFYERALDAAKRLPSSRPADLGEIAEALGDTRYKLAEFGQAAVAYRRARDCTVGAADQARLLYKCSLVADRAGQFGSALRWLTKARRALEQSEGDAADRLRAECSAQEGLIRHWQGRDAEAVTALRAAVMLAEKATAEEALATALVWLDNCEMTLGIAGTGEHAHRALEIWRRFGNRPWEEARVLNQLGIRAYFEGRWDLAVKFYGDSKDACDRAGDQFTAAVESANMAEVLSDQGHLEAAEPLLRDAQRVWRAAAAPSFVAFGKSQLGRLAARLRRFDDALEMLNSARDDYQNDGEQAEVVETDARIAECLALRGDFAAALRAADDALAKASAGPGLPPQIPLLQRVRGFALFAEGDASGAFAALDASLSAARERNARHEIAWTLHALSTVRALAGSAPVGAELLSGDAAAERVALFEQLGIAAVVEPAVS
jgi:predicted ATPase/class 3 adenylate cyclase